MNEATEDKTAADVAGPVDPLVMPVLQLLDTEPNYNISFHKDGGTIGTLDFNGPGMVFTGDAEASAKVFIDWIAASFSRRLAEERERCAKLCDEADKSTHPADLADAIRELA